MNRILLDANVILRLLLADHPDHHARAVKLFASAERGEWELVLESVIVAELVWVLDSYFGRSREEIAQLLDKVMMHSGVRVRERAEVFDAVAFYRSATLDFVDCLLAAQAKAQTLPVASFNRDLRKFPGLSIHKM